MKIVLTVLALSFAVACGKKVEAVPTVTVPTVEAVADAGLQKTTETLDSTTVECSPDHPPVPEVLQSRPEQAVCNPVK
jgi:hypothetical protein